MYPPYTAFPGLLAPVRLRPYPYLYTGLPGTDTWLAIFANGGKTGTMSPDSFKRVPKLSISYPSLHHGLSTGN